MKRRITVAACLLAAVGATPANATEPAVVRVAQGHSTQHAAKKYTRLEGRYLGLYWEVVRRHGRRSPGRNLVTRGIRTHGRVRPASRGELARSVRTFGRWLAPPVAAARPTDNAVGPSGLPASPAYQGGRWSIPSSIVMCESGGNYNAVNGSSGARGAYQLMPSTYYSHGGDGSWSPADQDRVAARVWAGGAGRGQWVC